MYVTIESEDIIHNVTIPPKSFLLVQNDQYVQSEQVIAEIRAGTYTFNFKERVRKHIYSDSEGEMHWSTDVYHAPEFTYSNVHLLPKTSHLWIFSGGSRRSSVVPFSLQKDQFCHFFGPNGYYYSAYYGVIPDLSVQSITQVLTPSGFTIVEISFFFFF